MEAVMTCPEGLHYTKTHEWIRQESESVFVIGVTEHAQAQLGDIVFVELPEVNTATTAGDDIAVLESVKTAADIYAPIAGAIVEVNESLRGQPELINSDPYQAGWLVKIKVEATISNEGFLSAASYQQQLEAE